MQCLSITRSVGQSRRVPTFAMARVSASISSVVRKLAEEIRKAAISMSE